MSDEIQFGLFDKPPEPPEARCAACGIPVSKGHKPGCPNEEPPPRIAPGEFPETREAVERSAKNANPLWVDTARSVGVAMSRRFPRCTAADFDLAMMRDFPNVKTHDTRAMGGVVRWLIREGYFEKTNDWQEDPRPNCHNGGCRVLRSLAYISVEARAS